MAAPIRLLIADDHRLLREGLAHIIALQPDMRVVAEAGNGEEAVAAFMRVRPDVTLMDLQMPIMAGLEAIRAIRACDPHARIVVLTMYHGDEDVFRAFEAGAMGYLLKDAVPDDLTRVLRSVHAGERVVPADIVAALEAHARQPSLTPR
jgi:DNA-binding NarL/FixJ family response regulator